MRATLNGSEKLVETVAPRPTRVVQAASAVIRVVGSKRHRNEGWSVGSIAIELEMNSRSNLPRSEIRAISCITGSSMWEVKAPSWRQPALWLPRAENEDAQVHLTAGRLHGVSGSCCPGRSVRRPDGTPISH